MYVFHDVGPPLFPWQFPTEHVALAGAVSSLWSQLAHGVAPPRGWPLWRNATQQTLVLDVPQLSVAPFLRARQCDLWDKVGYANERRGPLLRLLAARRRANAN